MADKIEVKVIRQITIEQVEGGLMFVSLQNGKGQGERKAATSSAGLIKVLAEMLGLEKAKRGRKPKAVEAPAPAQADAPAPAPAK